MSTDTSRPLRQELIASLPGIVRIIAGYALLVLAVFAFQAVLTLVFHLSGHTPNPDRVLPSQEGSQAVSDFGDFPVGLGALVTLGFWLFLPITWFFIPLCACSRLPLLKTIELAFDAFATNPFVWKVSAATALIIVGLGIVHGVAAVPVFPILGAMTYVAYKHVFLGQPPRKVEAMTTKPELTSRLAKRST